MGFQFSLAAVLRIRGMVEEREERLLQQIVLEFAHTVDHLERTGQELTRLYASMGEDTLSVGHEIHAAYGEVRSLVDLRKDLEGRLEKLQELRDKQRIVYEAARRDREMLTDLHQKSRSVYDLKMARREQQRLDDNYIARLRRGSPTEKHS